MKLQIKYVSIRDNIYYFTKRIPSDLIEHYGTAVHKMSLGTSDLNEASRKAATTVKLLEAEYESIRNGKDTPKTVIKAAQKLLKNYGAWGKSDEVFDPTSFSQEVGAEVFRDELVKKARAWATEQKKKGDPRTEQEIYDSIDHTSGVLTPAEIEALQILRRAETKSTNKQAGVIYLSDAFTSYFKEHKRGNDPKFFAFTKRHMDYILEIIGDIPLTDLSRRTHGFLIRDTLISKGFATATVRRILNTANAIISSAVLNYELPMQSPFQKLTIQGEGMDAKAIPEFSVKVKDELRAKFKKEKTSAAILIRLLFGTGARVGELAQLAMSDIYLEEKIPYIWLRPNSFRNRLKTDTSVRQVVLVGDALEAMQLAVSLHKENNPDHEALFPEYASSRGGDSASAAVKKRLKPFGLTSKCGRHWWNTAARMAGVGKEYRTTVLGHSHGDINSVYGTTPLELLREIMTKVEDYR